MLSWENSSVPRARPEPNVSQEMGEGCLMGKMSSTDDHIVGTPSGRQLARTVKRRPEHERWCQALFAQNVFTPLEPKLSLLPAEQAQRQVHLTRGVVERFGSTAACGQNQAGRMLDEGTTGTCESGRASP